LRTLADLAKTLEVALGRHNALDEAEVEHAEEEGVEFHWLTAPVEILGDDEGNVRAMAKHFQRDRRQIYRWLDADRFTYTSYMSSDAEDEMKNMEITYVRVRD